MSTRRSPRLQEALWRELGGVKPPAKPKGPLYPICPNAHLRINGASTEASWSCTRCAALARLKDELRHHKYPPWSGTCRA